MSISSSNDRLPILKWRKVICTSFLLLIGFFVVWDAFWMRHGYRIQPKDDAELWCYQRRRASIVGKNAVVFTGSSRIRAAIDLDTVRETTGKIPFQLAVASGEPLPVLENLAEDESFNGTVIVEITEYIFHRNRTTSTTIDWIAEYNEKKYEPDYLLPVKSRAQSLVIFPDIGFTLPEILGNVLTGNLFDSDFLQKAAVAAPPANNFERSWQGYHDDLTPGQIEQRRQITLAAIKQAVERKQPATQQFVDAARRIKANTQRIERRGGRVILVNLPLNGELKDFNEKFFPKKDFWDVLTKESSAESIYYADYPQLATIETMDNTHLNGRNAALFTNELFKIIEPK